MYVLLWMAPEVLQRDVALMRQLLDRHLSDSWVLAWGPGQLADVAREWLPYKVRVWGGRAGCHALLLPGCV